MRQRRTGFTLLELLLVLAVVSILFTIGFGALSRFRQRLELSSAQRSFVEAVNRARSDTRRTSQDHTVIWADNTLEIEREGEIIRTVILTESNRIRVVRKSGDGEILSGKFKYTAPYGRIAATPYTYALQEISTGRELPVIIYGVTGKVKAGAR